ncbi:MAG: hypothetical protein E3J86_07080 [Candidatus Thorarchaeota archaeon]|nr:MAG: hypothetical protein E3J86_07080 [Candidatus Thorarchaeota archaeon]
MQIEAFVLGSDEGWTTVLIRSTQGEKIFNEVVKADLLDKIGGYKTGMPIDRK